MLGRSVGPMRDNFALDVSYSLSMRKDSSFKINLATLGIK
jgi:hypothetical protein